MVVVYVERLTQLLSLFPAGQAAGHRKMQECDRGHTCCSVIAWDCTSSPAVVRRLAIASPADSDLFLTASTAVRSPALTASAEAERGGNPPGTLYSSSSHTYALGMKT